MINAPLKKMQTDYYDVLNVSRNASAVDIRKSYHELAMQYHPDKYGGDDEHFKQIQTAYDTLSNEEKRREYDINHMNIDELFLGFMSALHPNRQFENVHVITPTIAEICNGITKTELVNRKFICEDEKIKCVKCNGTGVSSLVQNVGMFSQSFHVKCDSCKDGNDKKNIKYKPIKTTVTIYVPPGVIDGCSTVPFTSEENVKYADDMSIMIQYPQNKGNRTFSVDRYTLDLIYYLDISLLDALRGFSHTIQHPDGRVIRFSQGNPLSPGVYSIRYAGIVNKEYDRVGNLHVYITVNDDGGNHRRMESYDPLDTDVDLEPKIETSTSTLDIIGKPYHHTCTVM